MSEYARLKSELLVEGRKSIGPSWTDEVRAAGLHELPFTVTEHGYFSFEAEPEEEPEPAVDLDEAAEAALREANDRGEPAELPLAPQSPSFHGPRLTEDQKAAVLRAYRDHDPARPGRVGGVTLPRWELLVALEERDLLDRIEGHMGRRSRRDQIEWRERDRFPRDEETPVNRALREEGLTDRDLDELYGALRWPSARDAQGGAAPAPDPTPPASGPAPAHGRPTERSDRSGGAA